MAAGNDNRDLDVPGNNTYPCELDLDNIVCVAATTQTDARASFSNYSDKSVDLAAPGTNILSTYPAFGPALGNEDFETDPFGGSPRWTTGAAPGDVNTWARTNQYPAVPPARDSLSLIRRRCLSTIPTTTTRGSKRRAP